MKELLEAGVHFGHQTKRWNPKMKEYIFGERNGIYIIDLQKTLKMFKEASKFVQELAAEGKIVLFVGTKRQAQDAIAEEATKCGGFYINQRWLGGLLTNWVTVQKSVKRLKELDEMATAENAKVQLGYTTIYSPIDGRTGNLTVKQGNVVTANNMDMMTINQVEPIYVTFSVPEAQLPAIKKYMALGSLSVRSRPQDADNADEERGALTFVDNAVDVTTGTIKLKGTFPNTNHQLWPGQFVRVTLLLT